MSIDNTNRQAAIDGLRELADFLAAHPDVPFDGPQVEYCVLAAEDAEGIAQVGAVAKAIDTDVTAFGGRPVTSDTTHIEAVKAFGPAAYRAFYVCCQAMADHRAYMSYSANVRAEAV